MPNSEHDAPPTRDEITQAIQHLWTCNPQQYTEIVTKVLSEITNIRRQAEQPDMTETEMTREKFIKTLLEAKRTAASLPAWRRAELQADIQRATDAAATHLWNVEHRRWS